MGFFDKIFGQPYGGMFDFNRDGKTDLIEEILGNMSLNEFMEKEKEDTYSDYSFLGSDDDDDWRFYCEDGSEYGLDPEDYDTEEEYMNALEEAIESDVGDDINLTFSIDMPGMDALNAIKQADYPNKRQYDAAYRLCDIEQGTAYIPDDCNKDEEIEKCKFILAADTIAGKYLTMYDGFILAQAIKENFDIPIEIQDEDEEVKTFFDDLFMEIVEEDVSLALEIWVWCIKEFGPYQKYMKYDWPMYNAIISSVDDYPDEFLPLAIKELGANASFRKSVLTENKNFPYGIDRFISKALESEMITEAQVIFTATAMNPAAKGKDIENLINNVISDCSNWEELETMERFKFNILPIIKKMDSKRIQRLYPEFEEQVDQYISNIESTNEKYRYSRKYQWRAYCEDGSEFDIDPLDYETEEEYNAAIYEEKYGWRSYHSEAKYYGIDVNKYETEDEYYEVLWKKQEEEEERRALNPQADPLATTDTKTYNFCSVVFNFSNQPYAYLTGDLNVRIGDTVIVPVGKDCKEVVATVVSTSQHLRLNAPYPVDKAKKVIKKLEKQE